MKFYLFFLLILISCGLTFLDGWFPTIGFVCFVLLNFIYKKFNFNKNQLTKIEYTIFILTILSLILFIYRIFFNNGSLF